MPSTANGIALAQGLPDDGLAPAYINSDGKPAIRLPNQLRLLPETMQLFDLHKQRFWFPSQHLIPAQGLRGVVNLCTDPWGYQKAMESLQVWAAGKVPIFNHPAALIRVQNSRFLQELSRIDGLESPRTISLVPRKPDDFRKIAEKFGLRYPVRLQEATSHKCAPLLVVKSIREWDETRKLSWPGKTYIATEVPSDQIEAHRRWRISFVGRDAEVVSYLFKHSHDAPLPGDAADVALPSNLQPICAAILGAVGLDHWTAEFSQGSKGSLRLEHLWPGLPDWAEGNQTDPSFRLWSKLAPRLHRMVQTPEHWRMSQAAKLRRRT